MGNVLNRTTKEYRESVNTPDFPVEDWLHNPDLSSVDGVDRDWWVVDGSSVREATTQEKDANLTAYKAKVKAFGYHQLSTYLGDETQEMDRIYGQGHVATNAYLQPYMDWRDTVYQGVATLATALNNATDVATVDGIRAQFDLSVYDATKPDVTIEGALEIRYGVG